MKSVFLRYYLHGICILIPLVLILTTFRQLPQTFYQQDEWLGLGGLMSIGWKSVTQNMSIVQLLFADGRPFTRILGVIFYKLFSMDSFSLAIYSISFHFINTILIYLIINKLLKNKFFALLGTCYFAVADVAHQAITWFGASFGQQPSSFLIFLSILLFLYFIEARKKLFLYLSLISAVLSLYFKEDGIFLILFFIIVPFIFEKRVPIKKYINSYIPLIVFSSLFVLFRLFEMVKTSTSYLSSTYAGSVSQNLFLTLGIRAFFYPLTSFSLSFIPYPISVFLSEALWKVYYPFIVERSDLVFQTVVLDLIAVVFSVLLFVLCYLIAQKKEFTKVIIFALVFFVLSVFPYIAIAKQYAYMEPRYYYIPLLTSSILIAVFFSFLYTSKKFVLKVTLFLGILLYLLYLRFNIEIIRSDIATQVDIANERKSFIHQLHTYLPTLSTPTNIFYFTGNNSWLSQRNFTPFQNGFGYTTMVLYYTSGKIPNYLLSTQFLWNFDDEGVKSLDGLTYAYFNNYTDLAAYVKKNQSKIQYVHAFYYNRDTQKLSDISNEIKNELSDNTNNGE